MLKLIWTPGAAAAPDQDAYKQAIDTLVASYDGNAATAGLPRDPGQHPTGLDAVADVIRAWLPSRAVPAAAVKLMLHGYDYDPRHAGDINYDPFTAVYGVPGDGGLNARLSWLPLVEELDANGKRPQQTAIAFAWVSTGSLAEYATAGWADSYQYACVDLARLAAAAVAAVLGVLGEAGATVDVLAHSLGTRLFTQALRLAGARDTMLNNVILLDGAEFSADAAATFAGRRCNVVNVTNEVDAVLALGGEQFGDPSRAPGSVASCNIGRFGLGTTSSWSGIAEYPANWVDVSLDRRDVQAWFRANGGYTLTATASDNLHPEGNLNHWVCYTEPGNRAWLTDLLWKPGMNGGTMAATASLPKGVLGDPQPVFAGVGVPTTTPMTMAARVAYQRPSGERGGQ
jgi:hypothetical protein